MPAPWRTIEAGEKAADRPEVLFEPIENLIRARECGNRRCLFRLPYGVSLGRKKAGETPVHDMPYTFLYETVYSPGKLEAVSYAAGKEVSRACLETTGKPKRILLVPEEESLRADGLSLAYVRVLAVDDEGRTVPSAAVKLTAEVSGQAELLGFGSGNPVTDENYTKGCFTSCCGQALAVLRAGYETGEVRLTVTSEGLEGAGITLPVK